MNGKIEVEKTFQKFLDRKLQYLSNKNGFLGIDNKVNIKEKVIIVPFGLEKTVSYGGGTKNGPREIIKASHQVELFDEELNRCLNKGAIKLYKKFIGKGFHDYVNQFSEKTKQKILTTWLNEDSYNAL